MHEWTDDLLATVSNYAKQMVYGQSALSKIGSLVNCPRDICAIVRLFVCVCTYHTHQVDTLSEKC